MKAEIRYRDHAGADQNRDEVVMFVDIRVYIMGVEVSDYLTGDVAVVRATRGTDGTCSFTLDNNFDRFIIRPENLGGKTPEYNFSQSVNPQDMGDIKIAENDPRKITPAERSWIIDNSDEARGSFEYDERPKMELFNYKSRQVFKFSSFSNSNTASVTDNSTGGSVPGSTAFVNTSSKLAGLEKPKYDLTVGACVIHLHDEVRVWIADPSIDPMSEEDYRWAPFFTGVVNSAAVKRTRTSGESSITVSCADIRYMMRKMRIASNVQSADQKKTYVVFDDAIGTFADALPYADASQGNVKFENILADLSYRQLTRAIICGDSPTDIQVRDDAIRQAGLAGNRLAPFGGGSDPWVDKLAYANSHQSDPKLQIRGIGTMTLGYEVDYNRLLPKFEDRAKILEDWNDIVLFGIKGDWYTNAEVERIGLGTRPINYDPRVEDSDNPSPYSVLNGFVHYLFPEPYAQETFNVRNAIERAVVTPGSDLNMANRLDILTQSSEMLDYQFYVSPMGDIVFEFPMYDFMPLAFGKYAACYSVADSIKSDDQNDEGDGNVVTALICRGSYTDATEGASNDAPNETTKDQAYTVIIKSDFMAGKYGVIPEDYSIPWLSKVWSFSTTNANGVVVDQNALKRNTLISFGIIEFFKRISAMSSMSYDGIYNPFLLPNRPILNKLLRRIGLSNTVNISAPIEGAPSTSVDTSFIRKADHNDKFMTITGAANTPLSYASGDALALFSTAGLDNIRTTYGIEIIDPASSMVYNANVGDQAPGTAQPIPTDQQRANPNQNNFSMARTIVKARERFDRMKLTNPKLHSMISDAANKVGMDPYVLYRIMEFESAGGDKINPAAAYNKKNPAKGAQGVIQFMPDTLRGMGVDPETFATRYPTVESQMPLVNQYLAQAKKIAGGPLDSPYKAYMAVFLPAATKDNMFAPFTESNNEWIRDNAGAVSSQNSGVQSPAELMLKLGYNYYAPEGGQYSYETSTRNGPVKVTQSFTPVNAYASNFDPKLTPQGQPSPASPSIDRSTPGLFAVPKLSKPVSESTASPASASKLANTRTNPLVSPAPAVAPSPKFTQSSASDNVRIGRSS